MTERDARSGWAVLALPAIWLIRLYRLILSPIVGGHCRFHPTCSRYAEQAFRTHNPLYALYLTIRRLLRCHPLGASGVDEVPEPNSRRSETLGKIEEVSVHSHERRTDQIQP